jgi:hypothetical protein
VITYIPVRGSSHTGASSRNVLYAWYGQLFVAGSKKFTSTLFALTFSSPS